MSQKPHIVALKGGLGNQMLQFSFAKYLEKQTNRPVLFDTRFFEGPFPSDVTPRDLELKTYPKLTLSKNEKRLYKSNKSIKRFLRALTGVSTYAYLEETEDFYPPEALREMRPTYFDGYWMNCSYSQPFIAELREVFRIPSEQLSSNYNEIEKLVTNAKDPVFVHIRRGDYITNATANKVHGLCSLEYYQKAIDSVLQTLPECQFFFFSDDINWVKQSLPIPNSCYVSETKSHFEDLQLMRLCRHAIIANSTFSLWGALLQENQEQKVFYPSKWYQDNTVLGPRSLPPFWTSVS